MVILYTLLYSHLLLNTRIYVKKFRQTHFYFIFFAFLILNEFLVHARKYHWDITMSKIKVTSVLKELLL